MLPNFDTSVPLDHLCEHGMDILECGCREITFGTIDSAGQHHDDDCLCGCNEPWADPPEADELATITLPGAICHAPGPCDCGTCYRIDYSQMHDSEPF